MILLIQGQLYKTYLDILEKVETIGPKIIGALFIILIGVIIARLLYLFLIFLFKKFKLNELIDKLKVSFDEENLEESKEKIKKKINKNKFTDKIKVDDVVAKSFSYYILIVFLRISISYIGINEIEQFLKDLTHYLPNLFVGVLIGFFGIRFANFVYDVVYHALNITREKTSKIIASGAKIIILFFTLMVFLDYTKIVSDFIINTILIGFISMLSLAGGLAFGLGGKDVAHEILESFRK
ncbi:MAG: hypothetical protein PHE25_02825 [Candidatus Gracilibacteria bacterium]|nr:hypothetical protein [Candidatus Gracilibacteria bacterium]